ncbi:uncharacterized protein K452DRAFT_294599 [Aplosporella prunicola CBS 121167]|uniref:[histone H3]-trimethyl-L-lysine(9) demethylase n=1 Tax=Aplosporella prunicola CBS 121167 TaxID=1176127 RepID=A0A6A6BTN1_9PEZI|nr:uncharacterized protein K452DRAFT_294599 [Aplosporella prunicola CBS 121167]KAF2145981.1 hypothetical protein K452DRAFT_294599 [Aplosporella prunicola CBS 121167]
MDVLPTTEIPHAPDNAADASKLADQKAALTPPTSEDMNKREGSSSELSELELDDDDEDIGEIEPDHYWDGGKIPVFKPTMDQFRSFKKFVDKIDKFGMKSGIVKVIPPKEWRDSLPDLTEAVKSIKINRPISQDFQGRQGQYTQQNIEKQRSYNLPQWKALTEELDHQPPAKRGARRGDQPAPPKTRTTRSQASSTPAEPATKRPRGRPRKQRKDEAQEQSPERETGGSRRASQSQVPPTPTSPSADAGAVDKKVAALKKDATEESPSRPRGRQPKSISSRRKNNRSEAADEVDEESFQDFDYHLKGLEEFTPERCAELEQNYWKTINFGQPMYGADMPGSLFDESTTSWNVAKLENLLDVLGTKVPGVNTAYLYLGMWKATFAWHLEDVDLYSINYIHFGAPKQWYSISQEDARRFENAMKSIWPNDAKNCSQFLRHKTYLVSPQRLESEFGIKVNKLVHYEGEFVLTYPYGYHSGYNIGYNCAESVNFATEQWLEYGRIAKKCDCESDSVWVDVAEIERKLRGEPTPEYYEETDDEDDEEMEGIAHDLPSPPASVKGKARIVSKKRKRDADGKEPEGKVKRVKLRLRVPHKEPCVLCPNDVQYDVLLPADNGQKAHRICALYTPETYIIEEDGVERVCNVSGIDKARLDLKCNYCRSKKGACFQCAAKKCTRAFHATCAAAAGVQIDDGPVPTFDEDGTEYFCEGFDLRCRFHRPKRAKITDIDTLENNKLVPEYAKDLKPQQVIQAQYLGGEIFAGMVVECKPSELSVIIDVLPDCKERVEVEWKYLLVLDPKDSLRPKPSANAKPLPDHLNTSSSNLNSRNQKDGPPETDDPFCDPNAGQKWAEFHTASAAEVRNPFQVKVNFDKSDQIWHYLGKTSTEARAQFTNDHKRHQHNPKSNFLETVKPPPRPPQSTDRRSLAATYPTGANINALNGAMAAQRQSLQPQYASAKPYDYKPKASYAQSPYANVPLAQHGSPMQQSSYNYGAQPASRNAIPPYPYHQYGTQSYSSGSSRPSFSTPTYTQASPTPPYHQTHPHSPYANYYDINSGRAVQYPGFNRSETYSNSPYAQRVAPVAPMMGSSSASMSPPAQSPSIRSESVSSSGAGQPDIEYLQFLQRFPYLRNAYLRRPKVYESPYPGNSGFSAAYDPRRRSMSQSSYMANGYGSYGGGHAYGPGYTGHNGRPSLTFQSPQDFQADVNKQQSQAPQMNGMPKFEMLLKQLSHANENAAKRFAQTQASLQQTQQQQPPQAPQAPQAQAQQPQAQAQSASPPAAASTASTPNGATSTQIPTAMGLSAYTGPSNTRGYRPGYGYDSGAFGPATQTRTPSLDDTNAAGIVATTTTTNDNNNGGGGNGNGGGAAVVDPALGGPPATPINKVGGDATAGAGKVPTPQPPAVSPISDVGAEAAAAAAAAAASATQAMGLGFGGETWRYTT